MVLLQNWQGSRGILQIFIKRLFCWFAWFLSFSLAQLEIGEGVTGSVNFISAVGITCLGNLAAFVTSLTRGRLDLENGARDALVILRGSKLINIDIINGNGLVTDPGLEFASVVMLSNGAPNSSITEFMKSNASYVCSILLQFFPLKAAGDRLNAEAYSTVAVNAPMCQCRCCHCIVFCTVEDITAKIDHRMCGTLKRLSDSLCLLPCLTCLRNGCHGCNHGLLRAEEGRSLTESDYPLLCQFLEDIRAQSINAGEPVCICIPLGEASDDTWTQLLIRCFKSKDAESRGVRVLASEALENSLGGGREATKRSVEYNIASFIVPRITEVLINIVLTGWFMVDGFSASLVARRTIRDYIVDSKGSGFAANAYLTGAVVKSSANNTCQALRFRGNIVGIRTASFTVGCVNVVCSIVWAVLIAFDDTSPPPSVPVLAIITTAFGILFGMDLALLWFIFWREKPSCDWDSTITLLFFLFSPLLLFWWCVYSCFFGCDDDDDDTYIVFALILVTTYIDVMCFVFGCLVAAGTWGENVSGKWIYSALQILVCWRWGLGAVYLDYGKSQEFFGQTPSAELNLMYPSAFLLNSVLAGVRSTWGPWLWKNNYLWSRKHGH